MLSNRPSLLLLGLLFAVACGQPSSEGSGSPGAPAATAASLAPPAAAQAAAAAPAARVPANEVDPELPSEKFTNGARSFNEVRDALIKSYYAEGITEDDLYRAATIGMLERLDPRMRKYNKLMSPREVAELKNDLKGEVVGVGVQIAFDEKSGYTDVVGTIPSSPAERVGLVAGDKIVTVNGKLYKGMRLMDVIGDIRGKAGEPVTLSVLRGDKLQSFTIVREKVAFDSAGEAVLPGKLGYLKIPSFTDKTPDMVRASLSNLERSGVQALAVDLRHSPGGSFERAIETASLLLPEGSQVVVLKSRGKPDETRMTKGKPILVDVPVVVLVDNETSSGAEFLAGALQEIRHAKLVGAHTHGKWSVQSVDDLPNGYGYKYTIGLFQTPGGRSFEGSGIAPDLESSMDETTLLKANAAKPEDRLAIDVQLRTAKELLIR